MTSRIRPNAYRVLNGIMEIAGTEHAASLIIVQYWTESTRKLMMMQSWGRSHTTALKGQRSTDEKWTTLLIHDLTTL